MADNITGHDPFAELGVATCFNAQTFLGSANEYNNGELNSDIGGACVAIASTFYSVDKLLLRSLPLNLCLDIVISGTLRKCFDAYGTISNGLVPTSRRVGFGNRQAHGVPRPLVDPYLPRNCLK